MTIDKNNRALNRREFTGLGAASLLSGSAMLTMPLKALAQAPTPARKPAETPDRTALLKGGADALQAGKDAEAARLFSLAADRYQSVRAYLELARLQARAKDTAAAMATATW